MRECDHVGHLVAYAVFIECLFEYLLWLLRQLINPIKADSASPYGHGMICSFLAIFAALFAISTHSEAGGACISNTWAFKSSVLCSLLCAGSTIFGAYLSIKFAILAGDSKIKGVHEAVIDKLKVHVLHNEIAILQSCLYIECVLQELELQMAPFYRFCIVSSSVQNCDQEAVIFFGLNYHTLGRVWTGRISSVLVPFLSRKNFQKGVTVSLCPGTRRQIILSVP